MSYFATTFCEETFFVNVVLFEELSYRTINAEGAEA